MAKSRIELLEDQLAEREARVAELEIATETYEKIIDDITGMGYSTAIINDKYKTDRISKLEQALQRIEGHTAPSNAPIDPKWINAIASHALKG